ncbi:MAG: transcriptional regulator, AraC family [Herbinix sp.]|jgi:YesN/AraC family two-component response regulator|nr:transcriptional regulator, AraC family [Herbinix sp.]
MLRKETFMKEHSSCKDAIAQCIEETSFAIAHLYHEEKTMNMHIHDCYEIYYSISGGKQFLIDHTLYDILPGDLFVINQYESHYLTKIDSMDHERIVISIHPDFLRMHSTERSDLNACFTNRAPDSVHKLSLSKDQQNRFMYYINKILTAKDYGSDIIERSSFLELMVMLNGIYQNTHIDQEKEYPQPFNQQVDEILDYINKHMKEPLTIQHLSENFYLSTSYICRIFKAATGTTINKYLNARRISIAKALLSEGLSVTEVCEQCGYNDYSNFLKTFTKAVGISPKKYARYSNS